jgi:hypothetical protein
MKKFVPVAFLVLWLSQVALATTVGDILAPINKIYDLLKAIISVVGIIAITIAGALYMTAGSNIQSRENAKNMVSYAIIGLVLVWVAPLIVSYLTATSTASAGS